MTNIRNVIDFFKDGCNNLSIKIKENRGMSIFIFIMLIIMILAIILLFSSHAGLKILGTVLMAIDNIVLWFVGCSYSYDHTIFCDRFDINNSYEEI
jgi:hypothetical protein